MKTKTRWMKNVIAEAGNCNTKMPWERGAQRQAMIARRMEREGGTSKITLPPLPAGLCISASA